MTQLPALRPAARAAAAEPAAGSRAQVACGRGDVWASAACVGFDKLRDVATYAVRIANNSELALRARLRPHAAAMPASEFAIAPFSIVETIVPLRRPARGIDGGASVEVTGTGLMFSIDAPEASFLAPIERGLPLRIAAMLGVLLLLLGIAAAALVMARASAQRIVAAATVKRSVPSPLAQRHSVAHARARTRDAQPLLDDLFVSPLPARAGRPLRVAYATAATAGDVWLLDLHGQVWAHAKIDPSGTTWLQIPQSAAGREMRVVVHAQRGALHAQTGAGIIVVPDDANVAAAASASALDAAPAVSVSPLRAAAGSEIHVTLPAGHGEALVSLTDASGSVVSEVDVPASERAISVTAPGVAAATTYDVVVSLSRGVSQEEVVRPVTVVPAAP